MARYQLRCGRIAVSAMLTLALAALASAQSGGGGRQGSPRYDVNTETTISGTIESVETVTGPGGSGRRGLGGTHVTVKTKTETLEVHLGPTAYLTEHKIALTKGDSVEILGSRVTIDNEPVLLAREVRKGTDKWTLRDASGRPLWSGPRR